MIQQHSGVPKSLPSELSTIPPIKERVYGAIVHSFRVKLTSCEFIGVNYSGLLKKTLAILAKDRPSRNHPVFFKVTASTALVKVILGMS